MRLLLGILSASLLLTTSCVPNRDNGLYHSSGRPKPIVAILPVIDHSNYNPVSWDLSEEMTQLVRNRVSSSSKLYMLKNVGDYETAQRLSVSDISQLSTHSINHLGAAEFVVVSEIIDQNFTTYGVAENEDKPYLNEVGGDIDLKVRVRVLDIRGEHPKVVLQEVLEQRYDVGRPYLGCDYDKAHFGTEAYDRTPLGIIHHRIAREIVARIEGYIIANKG